MTTPLTHFTRCHEMLLSAICAIGVAWREANRRTGHRFNVFELIGKQEDEATHSRMIAALLDPKGPHGQGDLFLREFLATLGQPADLFQRGCSISREKTAAGRRLDLVLESRDALIVIENKIGAAEAPDQLRDYLEWVKNNADNRASLVVFLTPDGRESTTAAGMAYCRMSYKGDVRHWLERCICKISAQRVRDVLEQYLEVVVKLVEDTMDGHTEGIVDFLAKPSNIEHAFEIARYMPDVKKRLLGRFLEGCKKLLLEKFKGSKEWEVATANESGEPVVWLRQTAMKGPQLAFAIELHQNRINYGICSTVKGLPPSEQAAELREKLKDEFNVDDGEWWLAWREHAEVNDEFCISMARSPDEVTKGLVSTFLKLFDKHRVDVSKINETLP